MDRLTPKQLMDILSREMEWYAGWSDDSEAFFFQDDRRRHYNVVGVLSEAKPNRSFTIVQARIIGDVVVIDDDTVWDKNLWKALVAAGVPREQIVLAYQGEKAPQASNT